MTGSDPTRDSVSNVHLERRELLRRAALFGAVAASPAALTACATSGSSSDDEPALKQAKQTAKNPLGVPKDAPLDVVIFKGGFSDEYAKYHQTMYRKRYGVKPKHLGTQEISGTQQTRFVNGTPPDVLDNSGAQKMDSFALIDKGQLRDLAELLDAPSWDDPKTTVRDTLVENVLDPLTVDGKVYGVNYAISISGVWHDTVLFDQNGWEAPKTWDDLMRLGERIKKDRPEIAPWTYQGQYPGYMKTYFNQMVLKHGGNEVMRRVDNLEDGAWQQDAIKNVLDALYELKARDFLMKGTSGLTHIQSQNRWANREAAFIPCGSWLKSEIGSQLPDDFEMAVQPAMSLDETDKMPYESCVFIPTETFVVPQDANNPWGGMEYIRLMLSKEGTQKFAELTYTLSVVDGVHDNQELDSILESSLTVMDAAREAPALDELQYSAWYVDFGKYADQQLGQLLTGDLDVAGFIENVQQKADETKQDPKLKKYER